MLRIVKLTVFPVDSGWIQYCGAAQVERRAGKEANAESCARDPAQIKTCKRKGAISSQSLSYTGLQYCRPRPAISDALRCDN